VKIILYGLLILPWSSLFKLDKLSFKRYLPVGTLTALIFILLGWINEKQKWWKVNNPISSNLPPNFPFAFGPFFILPIWMFKFTFGRFWLYAIINFVSDLLFAYPITSLFEKIGVYKMKKMTRIQLFFLSFSSAIIIYLYQMVLSGKGNIPVINEWKKEQVCE
jgi:hypothetical protein